MTLVETLSMTASPPVHTPAPASTATTPTLGEVVARIGAEVAVPLTSALERVVALANSGRIDRPGLLALRHEIEGARRVGLRGQQIARLASGAVRQAVERLDLTQCLRSVLAGLAVHGNGDAITLPPPPTRAEVLGDASLLHAVLDAAADWSAGLARANVDWRIDVRPWPVRARVLCRFAHLPPDHLPPDHLSPTAAPGTVQHLPGLDTLDWLLLTYSAHIAGVVLQRQDGPTHTLLTLEFLNTVNGTLEGAAAVDLVASAEGGMRAITGCQLLVLAARRNTRQRVREALQGQDLLVDYVSTVADAAQFCQEGPPQVLLYESDLAGDSLARLLAQLNRSTPGLVSVEVLPGGDECSLRTPGVNEATQLGLDALRQMLLPVLVLELSRAAPH